MENDTSEAPAATSGDGSSAGLTPSSSIAWMASALSGWAEISAAACRADAAPAQHPYQFQLLGGGIGVELVLLLVHLGLDQLVLRGDRDELARRH
jgi:hypothetical protein